MAMRLVRTIGGVAVVSCVGLLLGSCAAPGQGVLSADRDKPLTSVPGDADRGRLVFADRDSGHCVLCHALSDSNAAFQGNIGPPLDGIGARLDAAQIRFRIVDASRLNPQTLMPPYYRVARLTQVAQEFAGAPVLSAEQVEDVVAYLKEMK